MEVLGVGGLTLPQEREGWVGEELALEDEAAELPEPGRAGNRSHTRAPTTASPAARSHPRRIDHTLPCAYVPDCLFGKSVRISFSMWAGPTSVPWALRYALMAL